MKYDKKRLVRAVGKRIESLLLYNNVDHIPKDQILAEAELIIDKVLRAAGVTKIYRIYTTVNLAETSRDPDDIKTTELCYEVGEAAAVRFCNDYIKRHFRSKDVELLRLDNGCYEAMDFCSWPKTIVAEVIDIEWEIK